MNFFVRLYFAISIITAILLPLLGVRAEMVSSGGNYIADLPKNELIQFIDHLPASELPKNWNLAKTALVNSKVSLKAITGGGEFAHLQGGYRWAAIDSGLAGKTLAEIAEQADTLITTEVILPQIILTDHVLSNPVSFAETLSHEAIHHMDALTPAGKLAMSAKVLGLAATDSHILVEGLISSSDEVLKASAAIGVWQVFTEYNAYSLITESQAGLTPSQISAIGDVTIQYFHPFGGRINEVLAKRSAARLLAEFSSYYPEVHALAVLKPAVAQFMKEEIHHLLKLKAVGQLIEFSSAAKVVLGKASKKLGKSAAKVVPFLGTAIGLTIATADAVAGNKADAAVGAFGCVPVVGPIVEIPYTIWNVSYDVGAWYIDSCDAEDARVYEIEIEFFGSPIASMIKEEAQSILQNCNQMDPKLRSAYEAIANSSGDEAIPNALILELAKVANEIIARTYAQLTETEQNEGSGMEPAGTPPSLNCQFPTP